MWFAFFFFLVSHFDLGVLKVARELKECEQPRSRTYLARADVFPQAVSGNHHLQV